MNFNWEYSIAFIMAMFMITTSCKKDVVEIPEENDPVFRADGTLGGESFSIVAGDDNAYMYTMTTIENGVNIYSGEISNGEFSIRLGIYDGLLDKPAHVVENDLLNVTPIYAYDANQELLVLSKNTMLSMSQSQSINKIEWFVDGDWKATNEYVIREPGKYNVCADIYHVGASQPFTLCNEMIVGYDNNVNCKIDFSINQQGLLNAEVNDLGYGAQSIEWFLNGSSFGTQSNVYQHQLPTGYSVLTAKVSFPGGFERTKSVLVNGSNVQFTANDFTIFEQQANSSLPARDFNLRLDILKDGKHYASIDCENEGSTLAITGFEYYGKNDSGKDVYKVSAVISAEVKTDGSMKSIPVNFSTTFGIEIP